VLPDTVDKQSKARVWRRVLGDRSFAGNTVAQLAGRLVPGVLTLAAVPVLLHLLGTPAYGIIGFYTSFQIVFATLELGLTTTATREVARNVALQASDGANRNLLRTLEFVYGGIAVGIALLFALVALFAPDVVHARGISSHELQAVIVAAGVAIGGRWPADLYRGTLDGLHLQVTENAITLIAALVRIGGALLFVAFVVHSIAGYMIWQAGATLAEIATMGYTARRSLGGRASPGRFDSAILRRLWRFTASLTVVSLFGAIVSQTDKVIVGAKLPLAQLGYYTLAYTATGPVAMIAASIDAAALPRFSRHLATGNTEALAATYQRTMHVLAFVAIWCSLPLIFFANQILMIWTRSPAVAASASGPLRLLAVAALLNAMYAMPYTLALADGRSRIALIVNVASTPLVIVVTYLAVSWDGIEGAAIVWPIVMGCFLLIYSRWIHRVLLPTAFRSFLREMLPYGALAVLVFGVARAAAAVVDRLTVSALLLAVAVVVYGILGGRLLPPAVRHGLLVWLRRGSVAGEGALAAVDVVSPAVADR
jgi:O-antigen/teichoic acid export membrane protein